jgi:hypothetical protein
MYFKTNHNYEVYGPATFLGLHLRFKNSRRSKIAGVLRRYIKSSATPRRPFRTRRELDTLTHRDTSDGAHLAVSSLKNPTSISQFPFPPGEASFLPLTYPAPTLLSRASFAIAVSDMPPKKKATEKRLVKEKPTSRCLLGELGRDGGGAAIP